MLSDDTDKDWRLKLRYGKLTTPYTHFALIADGRISNPLPVNGNICSPAFMRLKVWAESEKEAQDILLSLAPDVGFEAVGEIYIYKTEPDVPPRNVPTAYDVGFSPYGDE